MKNEQKKINNENIEKKKKTNDEQTTFNNPSSKFQNSTHIEIPLA